MAILRKRNIRANTAACSYKTSIQTAASMMERPLESRAAEQYPLLKEGNGLSAGPESVRPPVQPPNWTVTCETKRSWLHKYWPEFISASWMTLILLGSSFLIFYALGMGVRAYRRPPHLMKIYEAKPSSNVYFHQIVQRECNLPLALYTPYLTAMATSYPNLRWNVIFLINDGLSNSYYIPRHIKLYSGLLAYNHKGATDETRQQEVKEFEKKHPNINITVMALNKFMAMTPLRFKWRFLPLSSVSFYARIFSVYQNGGIGMDLTTFDNNFCNNVRFDQRVVEILKNHNEGLPVKDYNVLLQNIDAEEDNCFATLKQILNDTISMFNSVFSLGSSLKSTDNLFPSDETRAIRTHRTKRNINSNIYELESSGDKFTRDPNVLTKIKNIDTLDIKVENTEGNSSDHDFKPSEIQNTTDGMNLTSPQGTFVAEVSPKNNKHITTSDSKTTMTIEPKNDTNVLKVNPGIWVYDFSIMSNDIGKFLFGDDTQWPPFAFQGVGSNSNSKTVKEVTKKRNTNSDTQLALSLDGSFVAAIDKMHQFLGMLLTSGFHGQRPEVAIQDTIITRCSGNNKDAYYCNIYGL